MKVGRALNDKDYFSDTFIPLAIITTLVITVIKFSLALSLGLVGALSIVRFRAAIKEPEELTEEEFAEVIEEHFNEEEAIEEEEQEVICSRS